jgi:hypothetical protein
LANTITADGSIVVGYSTNGAVVTNITNSIALPVEMLVLLAVVSGLVTIGKAVDKL